MGKKVKFREMERIQQSGIRTIITEKVRFKIMLLGLRLRDISGNTY